MNVKRILTWITGVLSFVVSYFGLMGFAFTPWTGSRVETIAGVLIGTTMLISFPVFLLFLRWRGLAVLLQWSAVVLCIASFDIEEWGQHSTTIARVCAAFSLEHAVFIYPLIPAVLLTILYRLGKPPK